MAHENDVHSAVPPPVVSPEKKPVVLPTDATEGNLRARIEAVAERRYRKQRRQLYDRLAELNPDTRRWILLAVFRDCAIQRRASGRQPQSRRRTESERCPACKRRIARRGEKQRIDSTAYDQERERVEALLREIECSPVVYSFCPAHLMWDPKESAICPHERWMKGCPECHGLDGPRGRGKPQNTTRRRLLDAVIPVLEADKGTFEACFPYLRSILRCFGDRIEERTSLRRYWDRLRRGAEETERALAAFNETVLPLSQIPEWNPQPDESPCRCPPQGAT